MMQSCFNCPVKTDNRSLTIQVQKLQESPLYSSYEEAKEYGIHWHDKWQTEHKTRMERDLTIKQLKVERRQYEKEKKNMLRGIEKRDQNIKSLNADNLSLRKELEQKNKELTDAERELEQYRTLFGTLDDIKKSISESMDTSPAAGCSNDKESTDSSVEDENSVSDEEREELKQKLEQAQQECKDARKKLEEASAREKHLEKKLGRNSKNCSIPSSAEGPGKGKVRNNREPSDKKAGRQPGHKGHRLTLLSDPDLVIQLITDEKFKKSKRYVLTNKTRIKQRVDVFLSVSVTQLESEVYYDRKKGLEVAGAQFPEGMVNEVSYGPSVKTMAMFLHTIGNMPYRKVQEFLKEGTDGKIKISVGVLVHLEEEFSEKTEAERDEIMKHMFEDPYMHIDASVYRCLGHNEHVLVLATKSGVLYFNTVHKGEELVFQTKLKRDKQSDRHPRTEEELAGKQFYEGVLIHDSEAEFFHYAALHQLCVAHELRYLRGVDEDEQDVKWAGMLRQLLKDSIDTAKEAIEKANKSGQAETAKLSQDVINQIRADYESCIQLGFKEYEKIAAINPESMKYRDGPNVLKRLERNKESLLYFLTDLTIPWTDNCAEKQIRTIKMHGKQCGGYFSTESVRSYLNCMGVLETERIRGNNRFQKIYDTFDRGNSPKVDPVEDKKASGLVT